MSDLQGVQSSFMKMLQLVHNHRDNLKELQKKLFKLDNYGERNCRGYSCRCPYATRCFQICDLYTEIANKISKIIRRHGGYKYCKAIGVMLEDGNLSASLHQHGQLGTIPICRCCGILRFRTQRSGLHRNRTYRTVATAKALTILNTTCN